MKSEPTPVERILSGTRELIAASILFNDHISRQVGMSNSEMQTIHLLQLYGPLSPGQLAAYTHLQSGSMTAVLDRLEALGFTHRDHHPTDRRRVVVTVNEARVGEVMGGYYGEKAHHMARAVALFTADEQIVIARFLAALNDGNDGQVS